MAAVLDALSWVLLCTGGFFILVGGIGALRMPTFYTRLHASSLTDSAGSLLVLTGLMLQAGFTLDLAKLGAALLFVILTAPTATYALANAAALAGLPTEAEETIDDPRLARPDGRDGDGSGERGAEPR